MKVVQLQRHAHVSNSEVSGQQGPFGEQESPTEKESQMGQLGDQTLVVAEEVAPSLSQTTYRESLSVISALKGKSNKGHLLSIIL